MHLVEVLLILLAEAFVLVSIVLLLRMAAAQDRFARCAQIFARRARERTKADSNPARSVIC
jgi:hypothetical protein